MHLRRRGRLTPHLPNKVERAVTNVTMGKFPAGNLCSPSGWRNASLLQPVKVVSSSLSLGGRGHDRTLVVLQHLEPAFQIAGGIASRVVGDTKISAEK